MLNDKKNENSEINFSLLNDIGHGIFEIKCQKENINKAIDFYKNLK
jgi:3-dehydroquinate synthase